MEKIKNESFSILFEHEINSMYVNSTFSMCEYYSPYSSQTLITVIKIVTEKYTILISLNIKCC